MDTKVSTPYHAELEYAITATVTHHGLFPRLAPLVWSFAIYPTCHNRWTAVNISPTAPALTPCKKATNLARVRSVCHRDWNAIASVIPGANIPTNPRMPPTIDGVFVGENVKVPK